MNVVTRIFAALFLNLVLLTAAQAEELAATAEEMSQQAEQLQKLMAFFRLERAAAAQG